MKMSHFVVCVAIYLFYMCFGYTVRAFRKGAATVLGSVVYANSLGVYGNKILIVVEVVFRSKWLLFSMALLIMFTLFFAIDLFDTLRCAAAKRTSLIFLVSRCTSS